MSKKILAAFSLIFFCAQVQAQISGIIADEDKNPLPGANLILLPDSLLNTTEADGSFEFTRLSDGAYELAVSFIGFVNDTIPVNVKNQSAKPLKIRLEIDGEILDEIIVTGDHAKQEETLNTAHIHDDFFEKNLQGAFAKSIEKLPGISAINVGVGIAKPVIRGLSANRIIVNHQGIKQESQQWGSDHGLEIDQFDIEQVEIIKGPGSLQYGSDGLGGVINIMPGKILPRNTFDGSVTAVHKTNNAHWGGSARLGFNLKDNFLNVRYSRQEFADYRVPGTQFSYNGFDLPILNNQLKNTAGNEDNISISGGTKRKNSITRFLLSRYSLNAGLFSGAVGIPRAYALTDDGNDRDLDVPRQSVDHYRASVNQIFFFGEDHLSFDVGFQRNHRREFSEPEFHSIPLSRLEDPNDKLAIELELQTLSFAGHYQQYLPDNWKNTYGLNLQWQDNTRGGFEYLLPNFNTFRGGIYTIAEKQVKDNWLINGGVRLDLGQNRSDYFRQFIWDSNETITDSLISPRTDDLFFNWSASVGSNYSFNDEKWIIKANFGKSFRVPYPAETVSNGIHHGTFRHEIGTPDLKSEQGYQLDLSADWNFPNFTGGLALYFNYFDNYIYLGPTFPARFSPLPEAGQIFRYRQDDAIYTGFELEWEWTLLPTLSLHQAIDFVQSYNPKTNLALPFTPQPAIRTDFRFNIPEKAFTKDFYAEVNHAYHFAASGNLRIDRSEQATPAYQLWGVSLGTDLNVGTQTIKISAQVQNLFNTAYLAHLSRYRLINVPEQGRNFVLSLKVPFKGNL